MQQLELAGCAVDLDKRKVHRDGASVGLTELETEVIAYLAACPGRVVSQDELLTEVWGADPRVVTRAVVKLVNRLRHKLEQDPRHPKILRTVRGQGYVLEFLRPPGASPTEALLTAIDANPHLDGPDGERLLSQLVAQADTLVAEAQDAGLLGATRRMLALSRAAFRGRIDLDLGLFWDLIERSTDPEQAWRLTLAATRLVWRHGNPDLALSTLEDHEARRGVPRSLRGLVDKDAATLLSVLGRIGEARERGERALREAHLSGDRELAGIVNDRLAACATSEGHLHQARQLFQDSLDDLNAVRASREVARVRNNLAMLCLRLGRVDQAEQLLAQAVPGMEAAGAWVEARHVRLNSLRVHLARGEPAPVLEAMESLEAQVVEDGDRRAIVRAHLVAARAHLLANDLDAAASRLERARHLAGRAQLHEELMEARRLMGWVHQARGQLTEALQEYRAAWTATDAGGKAEDAAFLQLWWAWAEDSQVRLKHARARVEATDLPWSALIGKTQPRADCWRVEVTLSSRLANKT